MEKIIFYIKAGFAALCGTAAQLLGGWDLWLKALILFMVLDIVTGIIKARLNKSEKSNTGGIDSTVMWNGGLKKLLTIAIVAVGSIADSFIGEGSCVIRTMVIAYYVATEALSVLENAGACGLPLPQKLLQVLEKLKDANNITKE